MAQVVIRKWTDEDPVSEITALLHRAYKELADMGFRYVATWQDDEITLKRLKSGISFLAEKEGQIVGTITLYLPNGSRGHPWYNRRDVAKFGQFGVAPELQRNGIGSSLLDAVEAAAVEAGVKHLALDTAEGAQHLIDVYKARGFEWIGYADWDQSNYRSVIMSKPLTVKV